MILVIEDNDGAAWTVCEEIDKIDLSSSEGRDILANMIDETLIQLREETESYKRECLKDHDGEDTDMEAIKAFDDDGFPINKALIGYASDEEVEAIADAAFHGEDL
jgi:hypothetical protein